MKRTADYFAPTCLILTLTLCGCGGGKQAPADPPAAEAAPAPAPRTLEQRLEALRDDAQRSIAELDAKVEATTKKLSERAVEASSRDPAAEIRLRIEQLKERLDALGVEVQHLAADSVEELEALEKRLEEELAKLTAQSRDLEEDVERAPAPVAPDEYDGAAD